MAQKINVTLVDDIDGKEASETVAFSIDGTGYEIDLSGKNAKKLRDAVAPYVAAGRKVKHGPRGRRKSAQSSASASAAEIRAWAKSSGYDVPARGRIPQEIHEAYSSAN